MGCGLWAVDCPARHNAPSRVGLCVDPYRDLFLRTCFVLTELLRKEKASRPSKGTSAALLPPAASLPFPTECAPRPPMASKRSENPCLSMSCAGNIHQRRGFAANLNLICFLYATLLPSPQGSLQCAALCSAHALLFIPRIW